MPAATYTEASLADTITITMTRVRTGPSTLDWTGTMNAIVIDSGSNPIKPVVGNLANILSGADMTSLKTIMNTAVSTIAASRGISTNT